MALKQYKPITPGQRDLVLIDRSELFKGKPVKKLTKGLTKSGGRNNTGRITSWQKGGGHKKKYRIIDFKRAKIDIEATVERIEYDKSFPITCTYDPADRASCPPLPGFNSTLCMIVPTGTAFKGIALPGLTSALIEAITLLPINNF